jgi:hypothetical protein
MRWVSCLKLFTGSWSRLWLGGCGSLVLLRLRVRFERSLMAWRLFLRSGRGRVGGLGGSPSTGVTVGARRLMERDCEHG